MNPRFASCSLLATAAFALACGARQAPPPHAPALRTEVPVRAYLLHLSHYDPEWNEKRWRDQPVDVALAEELFGAMRSGGMNAVVLDVEDGVAFEAHPELRRPHSMDLATFRRLVAAARAHGLEVIPKLNFAKGAAFSHNAWMAPYDTLPDSPAYWAVAFELMDELIRETGTPRYFHIGMDEDTARGPAEYVAAVQTLDQGLRARGLTALMWNDYAQVAEKASRWRAVERDIPRTVVQVLWDYHDLQYESLAHLRGLGFRVWAAPGFDHPAQIAQWRRDVLGLGGEGLLLTQWVPCVRENRDAMLGAIEVSAPRYAGRE